MTLPNALIIGPQKAGTSWIHAYLEWREDVTLPNGVKETFFYDQYFGKGIEWYQKHFTKKTASGIVCEVGPTYFESQLAPKRVMETLPKDVKLVVMLRDPANRVWSLYQHELRYGYTKLPFRKAVVEKKLYVGSLYADGLSRWKAALPEADMKIWSMKKDLGADAQKFANELSDYLKIERRELPEHLKGKVFEGGVAPSAGVARLSTKVGDLLRSFRLYPIVNFAKKLGLKQAIYGSPGSAKKQALSASDREWLLDEFLREDILKFGKESQHDVSSWLN